MAYRRASDGGVAAALGRTASATMPLAATQRVSTRVFESRMEKRREEQVLHDDLSQYHATNQRLTANNLSDSRVDTLRRLRRFQTQNSELAMGYKHEQQQREIEQRKLLSDQDEALAAAIAQIKNEKLAEETTTKRICDESTDLQELRALLKAAEINKIRHNQLLEKEMIASQEKARQAHLDASMEAERQKALDIEKSENERKAAINAAGRAILTEQMAERAMAKQLAYEAFLKEKAMVDEIVRGIAADDAAKIEKLRARRAELQDNIRIFLEERSVWRAAEKKRAQEELIKIHEYQRQQEERHEEIMRQKKKKTDAQDLVLAKLTAEIEAKRREEEEMQKLLYELYQEEAEQKALAELREREEKLLRMRKEMVDANEYQKAIKAQRALQAQNEEAEFRSAMMDKFASDARVEQMNAERRRREMAEYKKEVERLLAERRAAYDKAVDQEVADRRKEQEEIEYKLAVVERERQKLLDKYARELKDFLPKGVLRTADDYEKLYGRRPESTGTRAQNNGSLDPGPPPMSLTQTLNPINDREKERERTRYGSASTNRRR